MRGKLAKELRSLATGITPEGEQKLDRGLYKYFKRQRRTDQPKLPKKTRWERSPLHRAKMPDGSGLHFKRDRPLRKLAPIFIDLNEHGQRQALFIARHAGRFTKFELRQRVDALINDTRKYVPKPDEQPV